VGADFDIFITSHRSFSSSIPLGNLIFPISIFSQPLKVGVDVSHQITYTAAGHRRAACLNAAAQNRK
jgi:hypothetical protein